MPLSDQSSLRALSSHAVARNDLAAFLGKVRIPLVPVSDFDLSPGTQLSPGGQERAPHWAAEQSELHLSSTAVLSVDHRPLQTAVRNQGLRVTCLSFASLACMEAIIKEHLGKELDLAEQYCHFLLTGDNCDNTIDTHAAAEKLVQGVCEESFAPYETEDEVTLHCELPPSEAAKQKAIYKIAKFHFIKRNGYTGPSVVNPEYLEILLRAGHDVVMALGIAAGLHGDVLKVQRDSSGVAATPNGAHAMLLVGFDRTGTEPFFLFKESVGTDFGEGGYSKISYDYVRTYAIAGYIVETLGIEKGSPLGPMTIRVHPGSCCPGDTNG